MVAGYFPSVALGRETSTSEGIRFSFINAAAPFFIPVIAVSALAVCLARHSPAPALLGLLIPFFLLRSTWTFRYDGPTVERRTMLFGLTLLRKAHPLQDGDAASSEPIEDSLLLTQRPRWYRLTLWSSALRRDLEVMRSNQPEDLERTAKLLNAAIGRIRAQAAS